MSLATAPVATATTVTEVKLKPAVRKKLLTSLATYATLKAKYDELGEQLAKAKGTVEDAFEATGEMKLEIEGFKTTLVSPIRTKLDPKKLIAQGVTTAQIEAATITQPGKSYVKITLPGDKERGDE